MNQYPKGYKPLNYCRSCGRDFAGVAYFDRHRTGTHEYTFNEGLAFAPPRIDGRGCMDEEEMSEVGLQLISNEHKADSRRHRSRVEAGVETWGDPAAPGRLASVERKRQGATVA